MEDLAAIASDELAVFEGVTAALELLAVAGHADRAYVTLWAQDGTFANTHEWTLDSVVPQLPAIQALSQSDFAWSVDCAMRGENLVVEDIGLLPDQARSERDSFGTFGVRAVLQVPIKAAGVVLGVVGFNKFTPTEPWSPDVIARARSLAGALGVLLHRTDTLGRFAAALNSAEQANRAKDDLLAQVSHVLRTPLHAILGYAELIETDNFAAADHEAIDQIRSNGRSLLVMVEDLLEVSRLAEQAPRRSGASLHGVIDDSLAHLDTSARVRSVTMTVEAPMGSDAVLIDETRLRQIIHCAASAALMATGPGGWVLIRGRSNDGDATLVVSYDGPARTTGAGLGIPLAEMLLDGLGGHLDRVDQPGAPGWIRIWIPQPTNP